MNQKVTYLRAALLGLTLACALGVNTAPAQDTTNTILLTDYDNSPTWTWGYGYRYGWGGTLPADGTWAYVPLYNEGTNLCYGFWLTNTDYAPFVAAGGQYGIGFGGPLHNAAWDPTTLSTNLEDYLFSFDVRAEGFLPDQTTTYPEMQAQWQGPANPNDPTDYNVYQLNFGAGVGVASNWTHYRFPLSDYSGTAGWGNLSNWVYCVQNWLITGMSWNLNTHRPDQQFGFDDNNAFLIDNVQLEMITRTAPPVVLPTTLEGNIFEWNMDDKPLWGRWGGDHWSANSYLPNYTYSATDADMDGFGVGGSRGFWLLMDNTALAPPNTPDWAGGQNGCDGPANYSLFSDNVLKHYVFEVDVRAEGLAEGVTETRVDCQLFLEAPGDGGVQLNFSVPANSNWVHSAVGFDTVTDWGGGAAAAKARFATNYYNINSVRVQWQMNNAPDGATWGYDTDNRIIADNMKLVHYISACPPLSIRTETNHVIVTWAAPDIGTAILLSGDSLTGVTNEVVGVTNSPYVAPISSSPKYYRTQWVAP